MHKHCIRRCWKVLYLTKKWLTHSFKMFYWIFFEGLKEFKKKKIWSVSNCGVNMENNGYTPWIFWGSLIFFQHPILYISLSLTQIFWFSYLFKLFIWHKIIFKSILSVDTKCNLEDRQGMMDDRDGGRKEFRKLRAVRVTWWWWFKLFCILFSS